MEPKTELQRNAIVEARRKELETYQRAIDIQWLNNRMEDGRMGRCLALIKKEAEMEKDFQERTDHAATVNARAEKETALGAEIERAAREEACIYLRRHYLRERDPGLRELTKKLQAGYVRRDLQQQILHKEYKRLQEKAEQAQANRVLNDALFDEHEAKVLADQQKMDKSRLYGLELQQQLMNRQTQRQCQYEDTLIQKKMMDDVLRLLADEDQREIQHKKEQTEKMRHEMITFKKAKEARDEKQKKMLILEEKRIEKQMNEAADRSSAVIAERVKKLQLRERANEKIAAKILTEEAEREERENIIKQLQEQEYLEKNILDDTSERESAERRRADTKRALLSQMDERRLRDRERREREMSYRREIEAKMAAEEAKDKERLNKTRDRAKNYALELQKQILENEIKRRKEREMEERRAQGVWKKHKDWNAEVSAERSKIIEEHIPHILGYLQAGTIRHEDVPAVEAGLKKQAQQQIDLGSLSKSSQRRPKCNQQCQVLREY